MNKRLPKKIMIALMAFSLLQLLTGALRGQNSLPVLADSATVDECIRYAFKNQPLVKQLRLDEDISRQNIRIALSDWLPQINASFDLHRNPQLPVIYLPNFTNLSAPKTAITTGVNYNSGLDFSLGQTIFNRDVYIAGSTSRLVRKQAVQNTRSALIDLVVSISKAYYDVLLSTQQLGIIQEDIDRLTQSQHDAYVLYQNGVSDNIDYKRATILLENSKAQKKGAEEAIKAKTSLLKQLIGYPDDKSLILKNDYLTMRDNILIDTLQRPDFNNRIEFQQLKTNLSLQKYNVLYNRLSFLPSLTGYANYNINYQDDSFSNLYNKSFPNSNIGLALDLPIFQGTKRINNIKKARLQYERFSLDTLRLKDQISSEYIQAMASYKSNLEAYRITLKNIDMAHDVYNTINLQYKQGIKTYLEVIVSEADLMSAHLNNLNALYTLMFSKLDVDRARGQVSVDY